MACLFPVILMMLQLAPAGPGQVPGSSEPPILPQEPPVAPADPDAPTPSTITADEAVRMAIEATDRLQSLGGRDAPQAVADQVNRYIEIVQSQDPGSAWLPYLYGRAYAIIGRQGEAVDQLLQFVETREGRNEWRAYAILGDLFVDEFPQLARGNYAKAKALNPTESSVLQGLSKCAFKLGETEEAISLAREAVASDQDRSVRYVAHLADLMQAAGRAQEALREAETSLELAKGAVRERPGQHGPLLVVDARYKRLLDILQTLVNDPAHQDFDDYLRVSSFIRERSQITRLLSLHEALRVLEAGVNKASPDAPSALLEQYAVTLAEVDRTDAAIEVFQRLLAADPDNAVAVEWLARLRPATPDSNHNQQP